MTDDETIARVGIESIRSGEFCAMLGGFCRDEFGDMVKVDPDIFYTGLSFEVRSCSCRRLYKLGEDRPDEIVGTPRSAWPEDRA